MPDDEQEGRRNSQERRGARWLRPSPSAVRDTRPHSALLLLVAALAGLTSCSRPEATSYDTYSHDEPAPYFPTLQLFPRPGAPYPLPRGQPGLNFGLEGHLPSNATFRLRLFPPEDCPLRSYEACLHQELLARQMRRLQRTGVELVYAGGQVVLLEAAPFDCDDFGTCELVLHGTATMPPGDAFLRLDQLDAVAPILKGGRSQSIFEHSLGRAHSWFDYRIVAEADTKPPEWLGPPVLKSYALRDDQDFVQLRLPVRDDFGPVSAELTFQPRDEPGTKPLNLIATLDCGLGNASFQRVRREGDPPGCELTLSLRGRARGHLNPSTRYELSLVLVDVAGNRSPPSQAIVVGPLARR